MLIGYLDEAIRQGALTIRDPITQQELLTFVMKPTGRAEAQSGCHDDLVIALALVMIVMQRMPRPVARETLKAPEVRKYGQAARDPRDPRGQNVRLR